ncbi:hypothetical protein HKI87_07g50670 [Chloropicon roscoffensis]|uniref:Uncharacterized protein n=1 Tax=Chloropicon roscoffensis TaxID=1461544 RepID=A0AAX4PBC9_9CHLO
MEELAQPARKTFRGGRRGRGRGRDRHGQQRRQAATAEAPRQEERAEEDEEGHDGARGEGEDQGADLEELLTQVAYDRWVSSGSASSSHRWPHLAESPLGFEAENPAVELSADLFDLDLDALERALCGVNSEKLLRGLKPELVPPELAAGVAPKALRRRETPGGVGGQGTAMAHPSPSRPSIRAPREAERPKVAETVATLAVPEDEDAELDALLGL